AFSNHLYSTAAAGTYLKIQTIGIVRGEKILPLNPTLKFAQAQGMQLHFVDRTSYRLKEKLLLQLNLPLEDCYILPEGGTNQLAIKGCAELGSEILDQLKFIPDYVGVSCGTGGTVAGLISSLPTSTHVLGVSALKGDFLRLEVQNLLRQFSPKTNHTNFSIQTDYHFGGYAKYQPALLDFIHQFKKDFRIQLDPIYTSKMFYGIFDLIKKGFFPNQSKIVAIHTGGLQGIAGFRQRFGNII
ncbi:MAG: pyridoxal-phosphate dependent enzyme, partial [Bacteroidota bacterium]